MDSYDYEFYERLKDLITVVRESEQQRLQLEWRLSEWNRPDMKKAKENAARLQTRLKLTEEEDRISKKRNEDIQRRLNKIDACLKDATLPEERLQFLKRNCKNHLSQEHPNWKQYKDVLESQLREALQKVNGTSKGHPEKGLQESEQDARANVIRQSPMDQLAPSIYNDYNQSSRLQFPQSVHQDPYAVPPEKPRRSLPRIFDEETIDALKVLSPMSYQNGNQFALQDQQQQQQQQVQQQHVQQQHVQQQLQQQLPDRFINLTNAATSQQMHLGNLQPSGFVPVGYSPQAPIMMQVPLGHQMQRMAPQDEVYLVSNNIPPSMVYQQIQTPQQNLIKGGELQRVAVPGIYVTEDSKEPGADQKEESFTLLGDNGKKSDERVGMEHPQLHQEKIPGHSKNEKLEEIPGVHEEHQKSQISPEEEYHHAPENEIVTAENFVGYETPRKQNSFEEFQPVRALHSPEPDTPSRRRVKPVFSDLELTGDFDSRIVYGQTPPTKSSSRPVNRKLESVNDDTHQGDAASSGVKKGSFEATAPAATEDTDFGILSLPDNLLPAAAVARTSVSESGYRKTGDVTTADGFDTGVSNSIPGIRLSHSQSNPEERSYISDFESENGPPLPVKNMEPSDAGVPPLIHRHSKKSLWRSSSPVTPALSVEGLLLLMKMVENSFRTVSCAKDDYYRSFQPSDKERERIISEANNEGVSTIDADPALVSMIILEQMPVIIRSLSNGCLVSDALLQSENLLTLSENDIKSHLPLNTINLWECLFVHFTSILKHKVMSPKEVAAVFVPCLLQSGSTYQDKAFKLLVRLLENVNGKLLPNPMGLDEFSENSSDESPVAEPQRQTIKDKQEFATSIERSFSDGMDGDNRHLTDVMGREKPNELNISNTPAYKNMLFGFMGSISVDEDIGDLDSDTDELEKEFGTHIPDTQQTINLIPSNTTGKTTSEKNVSGIPPANIPSAYSAIGSSTDAEDSRDYDFYD